MSGLLLLELAGKRGLLDLKAVAELRKKLAASERDITAIEVADHLVKRGKLTQFQSEGLLENVRLIDEAASEGVDLLAETEDGMEVSSLELLDEDDEEVLSLTPLDAEPIHAPGRGLVEDAVEVSSGSASHPGDDRPGPNRDTIEESHLAHHSNDGISLEEAMSAEEGAPKI